MSDFMNEVGLIEAKEIMGAIIGHAFSEEVIPQNIMLHGSPGTAKSAMVKQMTATLTEMLRKEKEDDTIEVELIDVRLASMEPSEANGIPHNIKTGRTITMDVNGELVDADEQLMVFSTPQFFPKNKKKYYILFLDELTNANTEAQHTAYRLLLDRTVQNGSKLPDSCAVIAAGNLKSDGTGAKKLLPAAANRIDCHLRIDVDKLFDGFLQYMVQNGWNRSIIGYLSWRRGSVYVKPESGGDDAYATLRTWEGVNKHLNNPRLASKENNLMIAIAGAIGTKTAMDFIGFLEYDGKLPDFTKIRSGEQTFEVPQNDEGLRFAIATSISLEFLDIFSIEDENEMKNQAKNLQHMVDGLSRELQVVMFKTLKSGGSGLMKLFKCPELRESFNVVSDKLKSDGDDEELDEESDQAGV